jgi:hypothetical protein
VSASSVVSASLSACRREMHADLKTCKDAGREGANDWGKRRMKNHAAHKLQIGGKRSVVAASCVQA